MAGTVSRRAAPRPLAKLPVAIVCGHLGAGKTTLLNRVLGAAGGRRFGVLVNDFGDIAIDAELIVGVEQDRMVLANGCICCSIRGDLVAAAANLIAGSDPPEYVLVEASGVSDPVAVAETFCQAPLEGRFDIDAIVALVDADGFADLDFADTERVIDQVAVADMVLLNKADLAPPAGLAAVRRTLAAAVPHARLLETRHADIPPAVLFGIGGTPARPGARHHDHGADYDTWSWTDPRALSLDRLRAMLPALPRSVQRLKGVVRVAEAPGQRVVLQVVGKRSSLEAAGPWTGPPESRVVAVARRGGIDAALLRRRFEGCVAAMGVDRAPPPGARSAPPSGR